MQRSFVLGWSFLALSCAAAACAPAGDPAPPPAVPKTERAEPRAKEPAVGAAPSRTPILGPEASPVTFEMMSRYPEPGMNLPRLLRHSPDGKLVTFLQSESQSDEMALFAFDTTSKQTRLLARATDLSREQKPLSREEELRRERQRQKVKGLTSYQWAKRAPVMLIPFGGDVYVRGEAGALTRVTETPEPEIDPKICETGERVAFVRGSELVIVDVATRRETRLTKGAPEGVTRGLSDFNAQEEFGEPSGFWLSPACDKIAYLEVDERDVPQVAVMGFRGGKADLMMQRYAAAGQKNPRVRVGVLDIVKQKTTWLKWPSEAERYFGRFAWSEDGKALWLQALSRDQKRLALVRAEPASGQTTEVIVETSPTWVEFADMKLLKASPRILWTRAAGGHIHLSLRDAAKGSELSALTSGDWDVTDLLGVDEEGGRALIVGTKESPLERHLYAVPLAGGEPKRLTPEAGYHHVTVDQQGRSFIDIHAANDRMPKAVVRDASGAVLVELPSKADPDLAALKLRAPELVSFRGPSGDTLYGALLKPRVMEPGRRYPVVVMVYGGPGVQTVLNAWSPRLMWNHLADRNVVVFQLDNRGTGGRGPAFEAPLYGGLGDVEMTDQIAGVEYLRKLPFVDGGRVGIHGHSYGGTMAALALLKAPDHFQVGVAGAAVTDWKLYDTGYTERYMDTPEKNPKGYEARDITRLAGNLRGKLFLIHAMMDENVHFQNTALLIDALVAANKPFDMLVFPGERHGYRSPPAKRYVAQRVVDYLAEHL